jgi:hypothetical protein
VVSTSGAAQYRMLEQGERTCSLLEGAFGRRWVDEEYQSLCERGGVHGGSD